MVSIKNIFFVLFLLFLSGCQRGVQDGSELDEKQREYILDKVSNYQGLVKLYRDKLSRKEDPEVRYKLAEYYNYVGDYDSSLHYIEPLIESKPSDKIYLLQAKNLSAVGKHNLAMTAIASALKLNAKNGDAHNLLGVLQARQGEFNSAYQSFNSARALFVPEEQVINNLAMLMILQENYQQAYSYLSPLYFRGNRTPSVVHNLVFVLVKMNKYEEADNLIRANGLSENPEQLISELISTVTRVKPGNTLYSSTALRSEETMPSVAQTEVTPDVPIKSPTSSASQAIGLKELATTVKASGTPPLTASNNSVSLRTSFHLLEPGVMEKLVQPPPIMAGSTKSDISLSISQTNLKKSDNLNEVTNVRFGTHAGFSRLTLESAKNINFEKDEKNEKTTFKIVLNKTRQGKKLQAMLSKINKHIGDNHRDLKKISIIQHSNNSLLITIYFTRDISVNVFKIPAQKSNKSRLVLDFYDAY